MQKPRLSTSEQLAELKQKRDALDSESNLTKKELKAHIKAKLEAEIEKKEKEKKDKLELQKLNESIRKLAVVATAQQRRLDSRKMIIIGRTVSKYLAEGNTLSKDNFDEMLSKYLKPSDLLLFSDPEVEVEDEDEEDIQSDENTEKEEAELNSPDSKEIDRWLESVGG